MEVALPLPLQDLYKGCTKRLKVTRRVADPANAGQVKSESVRPTPEPYTVIAAQF